MRHVYCIGSATLDLFVRSEEFRVIPSSEGVVLCESYGGKLEVNEMVWSSGGGATNAAACFIKQDLEVGLIAEIGQDIPGHAIINELSQLNIPTDNLVVEKDERSATSIVLVAKEGGRSIVTYRGASKMLDVKDIPWETLESEWLYISSLGGQMELLEALVMHANGRNIKIAINPGSGELNNKQILFRLGPYLDVFMVNDSEACSLMDEKNSDLGFLGNKLKHIGAKRVIITAGDKGAILVSDERKLFCPAGEEKAVESTGAGDAFGSGFVSGLIRGWSEDVSLQFAQANAVGVISKFGAKAGIINEEIFKNGHKANIEEW